MTGQVTERNQTTLSGMETERGEPPDAQVSRVSVLLYHRDGAKVLPLAPGVSVVVGRSWPADAVIRDIKLSRQHARFTWTGEKVVVDDLDSTNGTFLNGEPIRSSVMSPGDEVTIGNAVASLHVMTPREESAHALDGHDRFMGRLDEEVLRARTFQRPLSVMVLRALDARRGHVRHFIAHLRSELRPVDFVGLYGPGTLLVALSETGTEAAIAVAQRVVAEAAGDSIRLIAGITAYPTHAATSEELVSGAMAALHKTSAHEQVVSAESSNDGASRRGSIVVVDPQMRQLFDTIERVARAAAPVLIVGETGTGKELVASAVHRGSPRAEGPLKCLNCGAIPETLVESTLFGHERGAFTGAEQRRRGLFEEASGGTLFLDEIGELPLTAQAALLRVLETRRLSRVGSTEELEVDVRIVAATHRDLEAMCQEGTFRLDLYYRLNTIILEIPALRHRRSEIEPLALLFAEEAASANQRPNRDFDREVSQTLQTYTWPGNVRELRNVMERAVVIAQGAMITLDDIPQRVRRGEAQRSSEPPSRPPTKVDAFDTYAPEELEFKDRVRNYETDLILDALNKTGGNQTQAAKLLRMPLRTLVHKLKTYGIQKKYE